MVDLLAIFGLIRDPSAPELFGVMTYNSGCSVEQTLLLHLAVVLAADTRPHNIMSVNG